MSALGHATGVVEPRPRVASRTACVPAHTTTPAAATTVTAEYRWFANGSVTAPTMPLAVTIDHKSRARRPEEPSP